MNAYRKFTTVVAGLLFLTSTCYADGNELLAQCMAAERFLDTEEFNDQVGIATCFGLLQGVRNTMHFMGNEGPVKACLPENGIDNRQATRIVTSYLKRNPASLHKNEVILTMQAFIEAYPCK